MIVFGCSITKPDVYRSSAAPGIRRAAEANSAIYELSSKASLFSSYNELLDRAAAENDLEALVLVHQDTEIVDDDFCSRVRRELEDPDVAVMGCVGAIGVRSIAWWEASVVTGSFVHQYEEFGGGSLPSFSWSWDDAPPYARTGEVETLDGFLLVLSPWAVRNLRFDESLGQIHGYDFDLCLQARAAGRKVVTFDVRAVHHRSLELIADPQQWIEAHIAIANKWNGVIDGVGAGTGTWKDRALRAEAEADAAALHAYEREMERDARAEQLKREIRRTRESISWRLTGPLRGRRN